MSSIVCVSCCCLHIFNRFKAFVHISIYRQRVSGYNATLPTSSTIDSEDLIPVNSCCQKIKQLWNIRIKVCHILKLFFFLPMISLVDLL